MYPLVTCMVTGAYTVMYTTSIIMMGNGVHYKLYRNRWKIEISQEWYTFNTLTFKVMFYKLTIMYMYLSLILLMCRFSY